MPDFLLELLTEEIPARMQARAAEQLRERFEAGIKGQLPCDGVRSLVTPRRLILMAHGLAAEGSAQEEERRGPRADAPVQALEGFLRSTGLTRDQLEERDTPKGKFLYATIRTPGRSAAEVIAELVPQIVRDFDWPKSMRWGDASVSTASPRWVRPLSSIVALLDSEVVAFEAAGIPSGRTTRGHRFMARAPIEITSAATYAKQLYDAKVQSHVAERCKTIITERDKLAKAAGLRVVEDSYLVDENAGLTEWPVPLLGQFDPAFLDVPREVIQLTMRTNQKYFACTDASGALAPAFVCVANLDASDGGATIVAGNQKVLAARLSDAKFFWDADRAVTLESRLPKLEQIVFHEKLGTVADKVERVAKLARWLVESGAVSPHSSRHSGEGRNPADPGAPLSERETQLGSGLRRNDEQEVARLADLAEQAARLCKADLVSATVGEFPEVQGIAGRYLALAEGLDPQVADAIRDHYKPVGQGDDVPTAPVSVAVALADKLDTLVGFFGIDETPTGSRDPFALRRSALGLCTIIASNELRFSILDIVKSQSMQISDQMLIIEQVETHRIFDQTIGGVLENFERMQFDRDARKIRLFKLRDDKRPSISVDATSRAMLAADFGMGFFELAHEPSPVLSFLADRLKVQQREAGIRPDIIDAVFALGGEDDLVRLLARVRALQAFIDTDDGANLLAGYRRAANILKIEEAKDGPHAGAVDPALLTEPAERGLAAALDAALPAAGTAVAAEDFTAAMTALAGLRAAVDAFFETVIVNADDTAIRSNRLNLLNRLREAVQTVADFGRIEK